MEIIATLGGMFSLYLIFSGLQQIISFSMLRRDREKYIFDEKKECTSRIHIIIPLYDEHFGMKAFVEYWNEKQKRYNLNVSFATTKKETERTTHKLVRRELLRLKNHNIHLKECSMVDGYKIDQIFEVARKIPTIDYIAIFDYDSRPEEKIFLILQQGIIPSKYVVFQFPSKYTLNFKNLDKITQYESLRQSAWSVGVEYFYLHPWIQWLKSLYCPYFVGHGLIIRTKEFLDVYTNLKKIPVEDFALGYIAHKKGWEVKSLPFFDSVTFVPRMKEYFSQSEIWFVYSLKHLKFSSLRFIFGVLGRSFFWAFRVYIFFILGILLLIQKEFTLFYFLLGGYAVYQILTVFLYIKLFDRRLHAEYLYSVHSFVARSVGPVIGIFHLITNSVEYKKTQRDKQ